MSETTIRIGEDEKTTLAEEKLDRVSDQLRKPTCLGSTPPCGESGKGLRRVIGVDRPTNSSPVTAFSRVRVCEHPGAVASALDCPSGSSSPKRPQLRSVSFKGLIPSTH